MEFNKLEHGAVMTEPEGLMVHALSLIMSLSTVLSEDRGFTKAERNSMKQGLTDLYARVYDADDLDFAASNAVDSSAICGSGVGQINPRPTWAGIRDYMSMEDLFIPLVEAFKDAGMEQKTSDDWATDFSSYLIGNIAGMFDAIGSPSKRGVPSSSHKTGYIFGRHERFAKEYDLPRPMLSYATGFCTGMAAKHMPSELIALAQSRIAPPSTETEMTSTNKETVMSKSSAAVASTSAAIALPSGSSLQLINLALSQAGLPEIEKLVTQLNDATGKVAAAEATARKAHEEAAKIKLGEGSTVSAPAGSTDIPSGKIGVAKANALFPVTSALFDFDLPVWEWDAAHPHVPEIDTDYVFREDSLLKVLYALLTNQPCYLHGHTGSGKTTLVEQVAARLNWPFARVNFDSEITRLDLIGRDVLGVDPTTGSTLSRFEEGILPRTMGLPYIMCFDEIDFVRPDIAYVMQRALEGNGLMLTEDGGRMIKPHRMFRIFATGNTVGQGDEFGMYQGARPQSMAFLDRFTVWIKVDYLAPAKRVELIQKHCPSLPAADVGVIDKYVGEHLEAFVNANVMQPISPRGYLALAEATCQFYTMFPSTEKKKAMKLAFNMTILDRATAQDRAVLTGIIDRVTR